MNETPVSRAFRDSRLASIAGGADEVMLTILCKGMGPCRELGSSAGSWPASPSQVFALCAASLDIAR